MTKLYDDAKALAADFGNANPLDMMTACEIVAAVEQDYLSARSRPRPIYAEGVSARAVLATIRLMRRGLL